MEKMFCIGFVFGALGGALLVANSYKARSLVKKSQAEVMQRVDEMMDERLKAFESGEEGKDEKSEKSEKPEKRSAKK